MQRSPLEQNTALQLDALRKAACEKVFDKASDVKTDLLGLAHATRYVRGGDMLTVWKLDPLVRSMKYLIKIITEMQAKGVGSDLSPKTLTPRHPAAAWSSICLGRGAV
jgi:DNA invertase Pin-like site-specific DNA recombinase